ncbi:hypothetical protein DFP74_4765 [Nocardiopsis sp. Huas11]|uniref:hypothetical protein n=1 Tax=Nocardiopsis sp. Huas11 TaxID=2183912 RepID=UPI000EB28298|nr:hypothetical protein [Nocardiopsis sp. Huas11]RKS09037.1 hypothetical protein DFP74_4765 [Nocardiopsis sp. Huas11]
MDTGIIVTILVAVATVAIVVGILIAVRAWVVPARRSARLKKRFGPEYDRTVRSHGDRAAAERELHGRLRRHENMDLRELTDQEREIHERTWASVQQQFVDDPVDAVRNARLLVEAIMTDRGYTGRPSPAEDDAAFERRVEDLSVEHPSVVAEFRGAHTAGRLADARQAPTEELREAVVAYRRLVTALLDESPTSRRPGLTTGPSTRR